MDRGRWQRTQRHCGILAGSIGRSNDRQADGRFSCQPQHVCQVGACDRGAQGFNEREVLAQTFPGQQR